MTAPLESGSEPIWPAAMAELEASEALVIRTYRRLVTGLIDNAGVHWRLAHEELAARMGDRRAKQACAALVAMITQMMTHARRRIVCHRPCCPCLSADEISILCLVASTGQGPSPLARFLAEWLVKTPAEAELIAAAGRVSALLTAHGAALPVRIHRGPGRQVRPAATQMAATIH